MATETYSFGTSPIFAAAGGVPYGANAAAINSFMGNQALQQLASNLPGYANMVGKRSENIQSQLSGQLPPDVIAQISQQSAERGVAGGSSGSPLANAAYLRALGLNSLSMMQQGSQQLSQAIQDTPTAELWNPASLWVPQQLAQQQASIASNAASEAAALQESAKKAANKQYFTRRSSIYFGDPGSGWGQYIGPTSQRI